MTQVTIAPLVSGDDRWRLMDVRTLAQRLRRGSVRRDAASEACCPSHHRMLREFKDANGRRWRVWDVYPAPRTSGETRQTEELSNFPHRDLDTGWLCFESGSEKRRIAPVPRNWEQMAEAELAVLCERAGYISHAKKDNRDERLRS